MVDSDKNNQENWGITLFPLGRTLRSVSSLQPGTIGEKKISPLLRTFTRPELDDIAGLPRAGFSRLLQKQPEGTGDTLLSCRGLLSVPVDWDGENLDALLAVQSDDHQLPFSLSLSTSFHSFPKQGHIKHSVRLALEPSFPAVTSLKPLQIFEVLRVDVTELWLGVTLFRPLRSPLLYRRTVFQHERLAAHLTKDGGSLGVETMHARSKEKPFSDRLQALIDLIQS